MKLRYRRLIYLSFIGAFIIITPIIILYTAGYRYNFKKHKMEKTGILYLDSQPKGALIYLNGKYKNKTPAHLTKLLPNTYQVEVTKDGYYLWRKELEVKSNLTTFSKNIILFKKNLPFNIIEGEINILTVSPNQEKLIYSILKENTEEIRLLNLKNKSDLLINQLNTETYNQLEFVEWSPSQNKLMLKEIIGDFNKYIIIDIETLKIKELFNITRLNFSKVNWDNLNDNYLYGLRQTVLYQIDLVNNLTQPLLSAQIEDFQVKGDKIYYLSEVINESFLNKTTLENKKIEEIQKIKLPSSSQYTLQQSSPSQLVLLDKKNNDLFIVNEKIFTSQDINEEIILQAKAKKVVWLKDFKNLLYYTDFEIWTFDFSSQQKNLITRYGEIINQALWYPSDKYIIYQPANTIQIIEADSSEIRNDIKLAELPETSSVVVDDSGKNLYFKGKTKNQQGIYQLEIQ